MILAEPIGVEMVFIKIESYIDVPAIVEDGRVACLPWDARVVRYDGSRQLSLEMGIFAPDSEDDDVEEHADVESVAEARDMLREWIEDMGFSIA